MNIVPGTALFAAALLAAALVRAADPPAPAPVAALPASSAPAPAATATVPLVTQDNLRARQARRDPTLFLLDVRSPEEFAAGHVPGAVNIPHDQVASRLAEVPRDKDVVLYCRSGRRAGLAADVLQAHGYTRLSHLEGDMNGWQQKSLPVEGLVPVPSAPTQH